MAKFYNAKTKAGFEKAKANLPSGSITAIADTKELYIDGELYGTVEVPADTPEIKTSDTVIATINGKDIKAKISNTGGVDASLVVSQYEDGITMPDTDINDPNVRVNLVLNDSVKSSVMLQGEGNTKVNYDPAKGIVIKSTESVTSVNGATGDVTVESSNIIANSASATSMTSSSISNGDVRINSVSNGKATSSIKVVGSNKTSVRWSASNQHLVINTPSTSASNVITSSATGTTTSTTNIDNGSVRLNQVVDDAKTSSVLIKGTGKSTVTYNATDNAVVINSTESVTSVAGRTGAVTLSKSDVGLGNVTNESKETMLTNAALTGTPTAPTISSTSNTKQIVNLEYLNSHTSGHTGNSDIHVTATQKTNWQATTDWVNSIKGSDTNSVIDKWDEIVKFLDGVSSTTLNGILDNYILKSGGTMTGTLKTNNLIPATDKTYTVGSAGSKYTAMYATTYYGELSGNAATATKLANSRTIWGQSFDGSGNVSGAMSGVAGISSTDDIAVTKTNASTAIIKSTNSNGTIELITATNRGVYDRTGDAWLIGTNGTNTWLSTGNVGIGTTSPSYKLHVSGTLGVSGATTLSSTLSVSGAATFSSTVTLPYVGGSWLSMATRSTVLTGAIANSQSSAHSLYKVKSYSEDIVAFGGLGTQVGFYGFYASRVSAGTNGYDWLTVWNTSTGELYHSNTLIVAGATTLKSTLSVGGALSVSGTVTASNVTSSGVLTLSSTGTGDGVYLKYNNTDAKSVHLADSVLRPFGAASGAIDLGNSAGKWRNGTFSGTVTATTFSGALSGNATTATTATNANYLNGVASTYASVPGTGQMMYARCSSGTDNVGNLPASNNANGILTVNTHSGNYYHRLGFNGDNRLYHQAYSGVAVNNTTTWNKIAYVTDTVSGATNATNATNIYVNYHTGNNTNYPLVWTNQTGTSNTQANQLYKTPASLYFNTSTFKLAATGGFIGGSFSGTSGAFSSTLSVSGATTLSSTLSVSGAATFSSTVTSSSTVSGTAIKATNDQLYATANGNTVRIGSQNTSYCHIYNSADIPFYFNKNIMVNGTTVSLSNHTHSYLPLAGGTMTGTIVTNYGIRTATSGSGDIGGSSYKFLNGYFSGTVYATTFSGALSGNATTATTATNANYLANNSDLTYGYSRLSYFNASLAAGCAAKTNDAPTSAWWHMLRFNHANSGGYYTDLAIPFNNNSLYWKCVRNGSLAYSSWTKILDSLNYTEYVPTKTGSGASGTWGISITGSSASCTGNAATATALTTSAGSSTQPVYFSSGKPVAIGYTIATSVPSGAVFTDTHYTTGIRAGGSGATANAAATNPYITVLDNSTYRSQVRLVGSGATSISSDASGNITISSTNTTYSFSAANPTLAWGTKSSIGTIGGTTFYVTMPANPNTDTHYTTYIRAGGSGATANAATSNPYITVLDNSTYRSQVRLVGSGATSISSDSSGNITISSTNTTYSFANKAATLAWNTTSTIATVGGVDITVKLPANPNTDTNTTNTTSSTASTGTKLFLVGATSQSSSIVTNSNANCYIGTDNCLYSGGAKVLTSYTNTTNTAGTSNKTGTKLFLAGAASQTDGVQTFSNSNCYIGTDNCLYSGGAKVLTSYTNTDYRVSSGNTTSTIYLVGTTAQNTSTTTAATGYSNSNLYATNGVLYSAGSTINGSLSVSSLSRFSGKMTRMVNGVDLTLPILVYRAQFKPGTGLYARYNPFSFSVTIVSSTTGYMHLNFSDFYSKTGYYIKNDFNVMLTGRGWDDKKYMSIRPSQVSGYTSSGIEIDMRNGGDRNSGYGYFEIWLYDI